MAHIYVASSLKRTAVHDDVVKALRAAGHLVYDYRVVNDANRVLREFVTYCSGADVPDAVYEQANNGAVALALMGKHDEAKAFGLNRMAMEIADICVVLYPSGVSAATEAGWFLGKGHPVIAMDPRPIAEQNASIDIMRLLFDGQTLNIADLVTVVNGYANSRSDGEKANVAIAHRHVAEGMALRKAETEKQHATVN